MTPSARSPDVACARCWFYPTPGRMLVILLAIEGVLFLCDSLCWIPNGRAGPIAGAAVGSFLILMVLWFILALIFHWRFQFSIRAANCLLKRLRPGA
jgi:hypothetical protein